MIRTLHAFCQVAAFGKIDAALKLDSVCAIRLVREIGAAVTLCIGAATLPGPAQALPAPADLGELLGAPDCNSEIVMPSDAAPGCGDNADAEADRTYLVATATPGFTMTRQGPDVAIGRLHPEFAHRLAGAIREARAAGLSSAGIFSAYRPPAFGVGGFSDKFNSLHSYGLAVDMTGIGGAGSGDAKTWYEIAARHGVVCPYGVENRVEWNHCQPTWLKIIRTENPLRETVTAKGPVDLESMFEAGSAIIDNPSNRPGIGDQLASAATLRIEASDKRDSRRGECRLAAKSGCGSTHEAAAHTHPLAVAQVTTTRARCRDEAHPHGKECGAHGGKESAERRATHARQADRGARESHRV